MAEIAHAVGANRLVVAGPLGFLRDLSYEFLQQNVGLCDYERPRAARNFRCPAKGALYQEYKVLETATNTESHQANYVPNGPALRPKNRYIDILPYEHSRVPLGNGYINASYIAGHFLPGEQRKYIAAQGPLDETRTDFWEMLWQERVERVFMLCNLVEDRSAKCSKYWPDGRGTINFGDVTIVGREEAQLSNGVRRRIFSVTRRGTSDTRTVTQIHYTSWPDHGVPSAYTDLSLLLQELEVSGSAAPILIHCSAGVGRTGTILALRILMDVINGQRRIGVPASFSVFSVVRRMREQRLSMVQTPEQYALLYNFMAEWIATQAIE